MRCPHIRCDKSSYHVRVFPCACALPAQTNARASCAPYRAARPALPRPPGSGGEGRGGATTRPPSAGALSGPEEGWQGGGGETHVGGGRLEHNHTTLQCLALARADYFFVRRGDRSLTLLRVVRMPPAACPRAAPRARARRVRARWVLPRRSFFFLCRAWPRRCACCRHVQPAPFALLAHAARSTSAFLPPQTFEHADTTASLGISRARACELPPLPPLLHLLAAREMAQKKKLPRAFARCSHARHAGKQDQTLQQTRHDRGALCHNARTDSNESREGGGIEDERMAA